MILGMIVLMFELPAPMVKQFGLYRSLPFRVVLLLFQVFLNILYYQVRAILPCPCIYPNPFQGTNAAIWSLIAAGCYSRAIALGEVMEESKANRGKQGEV